MTMVVDQSAGDSWQLYCADAIDVLRGLPDGGFTTRYLARLFRRFTRSPTIRATYRTIKMTRYFGSISNLLSKSYGASSCPVALSRCIACSCRRRSCATGSSACGISAETSFGHSRMSDFITIPRCASAKIPSLRCSARNPSVYCTSRSLRIPSISRMAVADYVVHMRVQATMESLSLAALTSTVATI